MSYNVSTRFKAMDRMSKVFKKMGNNGARAMKKIKGSATRANSAIKGFGKNLGMAGKIGGVMLAGFSFGAIKAQITETIEIGRTFEKTMVSAAAKFPSKIKKGSKAFEALEAAALKAGRTTEFSASESAKGLNFLALAGFNAEQAIAALPGVINLATAAETDLAGASDMATDTLGAFNLMTKDSAQLQKNLAMVSNVMAKTSTSANTDVSQLFEAIAEGGAVAQAAGVDIAQFSAMVGKMSDATIKGGKAGTTMKNILLRLQAPLPKAQKRFKAMGIGLTDTAGNMKDLTIIIDELNAKLPKGAKRAAVLNDIFGKIPIAGVNVLLNQGGQALRDYTEELRNSGGYVDELANAMRDNLDGSMKTMNSTIEALRIKLFKAFAPAFEIAVKVVTKLVNIIIAAGEKLGPFRGIITNIVIAMTLAIGIVAALAVGVVVLVGAIALLNALFVASPIGWVVLGLAAIIFVIIMMVKHFKTLGKVAKIVFNFLFGDIIKVIKLVMKLLGVIPFVSKALNKFRGSGDTKIDAESTIKVEKEVVGGADVVNTDIAKANNDSEDSKLTRETIANSSAEVTIKDETGRAEVTKKDFAPGTFALNMPPAWGL